LKSLNNSEREELLPIGKVIHTHGIHGELRLIYYNEDKTGFLPYTQVLLRDLLGHLEPFEVTEARIHGRFVVARFKGLDSLERAKQWVGASVFVERSSLPELEKGEYYWADIIGMEVTTVRGDRVGKISRIIRTGGTDVFVIETDQGEVLVPATEDVVKEIATTSRRMVIDLFEGLT
jgi:16S rRNA processing protein RimM